jgi:hypothetical protein
MVNKSLKVRLQESADMVEVDAVLKNQALSRE